MKVSRSSTRWASSSVHSGFSKLLRSKTASRFSLISSFWSMKTLLERISFMSKDIMNLISLISVCLTVPPLCRRHLSSSLWSPILSMSFCQLHIWATALFTVSMLFICFCLTFSFYMYFDLEVKGFWENRDLGSKGIRNQLSVSFFWLEGFDCAR